MSFDFEFTQHKQMVLGNPYIDHWFEAINEILPEYEINTRPQVAMFIAQCAHQSGGFRAIDAASMGWQRENGLEPDGIAGPATLARLLA